MSDTRSAPSAAGDDDSVRSSVAPPLEVRRCLPQVEPARPFKAAQSYGPADVELFFGRDAEGAQLARFLAERPLGIVTAPSGTGKTSLLHARVLPLLERDGWLPVYGRPQDDPLAALQRALTDTAVPPLAGEMQALSRLAAATPGGITSTLDAAFDWFACLKPVERIGLRLFSPSDGDDFAPLPMVCRTLRGSLRLEDLIEHFEALAADGPSLRLVPHMPLEDAVRLLGTDAMVQSAARWRGDFEAANGLAAAIEFFQADWAPLRPGLGGLLLIIDQFEELFTQLLPGSVPALLEAASQALSAVDTDRGMLPVHIALSLRKEFFADLVPHVRSFGTIERLTYFLGSFAPEQAGLALSQPAELFDVTFSPPADGDPGCLARVLTLALDDGETFSMASLAGSDADAERDARFAPVLISLIGAHLWERLLQQPRGTVTMPLSWTDFQRLVPSVDDVFSTFLDAAMAWLECRMNNDVTRFDALEMLDRLVTSTGFRNIIAEGDLIEQLPLPRDVARRLVHEADQTLKLVRRESRRGGYFVEIMHERLIPPVRRLLGELRRSDPLRASLATGQSTLQILGDEPDPTRDALPDYLRASLLAHLPRLQLRPLEARNLLRSLLHAGPDGTEGGQGATWGDAVLRLAAAVDAPDANPPAHALLSGTRLDDAIEQFERVPLPPHEPRCRQLIRSVLADRTPLAAGRIHRVLATCPLEG